jgi:hypothetical protein
MTRLRLVLLVLGVVTLACGMGGGATTNAADRSKGHSMPTRPIEAVLTDHTDALMAIPGVVGVGQGLLDDTPCITVFVIANTPQVQQDIPSTLEGYPVVVEQTGVIRPRPNAH